MFDEPNRMDIANMINAHVSAIRDAKSPLVKSMEVRNLSELIEGMLFDPAILHRQLHGMKRAARDGVTESVEAFQGIAEGLSAAAAQDGCMNIAQYKGKLSAAFESAKHVLIENNAADKAVLVDNFHRQNIGILLTIAERISALQGDQYSDPQAIYEAIKDVKIGNTKPQPRNSSAPKL